MNQLSTNAVSLLGLALGTDAILAQEVHGAAAVRGTQQVPVDNPGQSKLSAFGIELLERDPTDPLFMNALFPLGWKRVATGNPLWTHLVPLWAVGPVFAIFYKAAFYDRAALMSFRPRYDITAYEDNGNDRAYEARVRDYGTGKTLFAVPFEYRNGDDYYEASEPAKKLCIEWASANLPEYWEDSFASWFDLYNSQK